jgi:ferrous iron transport protein A
MTQRSDEIIRTTLDLLPFGEWGRVVSVSGQHPAARRLMEMGIVPGATISVVRAAPLGDPLQVEISGSHLALRRTEARAISVTPLTANGS